MLPFLRLLWEAGPRSLRGRPSLESFRREKTVNSCLRYFKTLIFEPRAPALQAIFLPAELGLQPFRG